MVKMKKFLALALSASMVLSLAACGEKQPSNSVSTETTTDVVATETTEETAEWDGTYPVNTDVTLTIWDANKIKYSSSYISADESPFHTGLEKVTGYDLEWQWPAAGAEVKQAFNLLLTEKVLPNIIFKDWSVNEAEQLIEDGVIYDLTEYLPKYAPNYWATVTKPEYEYSLKSMTTASGKQFIVASFIEDMASVCYQGPIVRKDWLDACGLNIPETLEDWEKMLVAFKEKYGCALAMRKNNFISTVNAGSATGALGALNHTYALNDEGQVVYPLITDESKAYITLLNKWWTEGLLDQDSVTMDNAAMQAKALNGEFGVAFVPLSQLTTYVNDAKTAENGAEWIAISYPREAEGVPTSMIQTRATHWAGVGAAISTSCSEEELIEALRFLDYGYTEEGAMYWNYGEEGVSYTLNAEGKPEWTKVVTDDPNGLAEGILKYTGVSSSGFALQDFDFLLLKNGEIGAQALSVWTENTVGHEHCLPSISFNDEEQAIDKALWPAVKTYATETALKFVTGEESLENWDAYVAKVNELGVGSLIYIRQLAYDRFMAE